MATANNYVVGKGRLFFDRFGPDSRVGEGFRYLGNTPNLTASRSATALDHFDSDHGIKVKDDSIDIETGLAGKFGCDNISNENMALFFGGAVANITQAAGTVALTETFDALPDMFYQIGVTAARPEGLRNVNTFTATMATVPLVAETDYHFEAASGLLQLLPSVAVATGGALTLSYKLSASTQAIIVERGLAIYGALKFVSANPKGSQADYLWPYIKVTAEGDFALKGDTWQQSNFGYEALKLDDITQRVYISRRG